MAATHRHEVGVTSIGLDRVAATVRATVALARRLAELDPDLVHTNSLKANLYGGVAARIASVPVVWHVRDRIASDYLPAPVARAVRLLARIVPNRVIANSASTLATLGPIRDATVVPSPLGFAPVLGQPERPNGPFRVAMVGRLAPWKGQDIFLDAFAEAFPDGDERALIVGSAMFGEDSYAQELTDRTIELGIDDRVELTGFVDDVQAILASVDCLVHASITPEPFGQVVIEGMASGIVVIASDGGGPSEILTDGVDGILYPPGDRSALAAALRRVAVDSDLRRKLVDGALREVRAYEPDQIAQLVQAVYGEVLATRR
jgi:glycosyltransferase involved in cell wall biosynthesis